MSITRSNDSEGRSVVHVWMKLFGPAEGVPMTGKALDISLRARRQHQPLEDSSGDFYRVLIGCMAHRGDIEEWSPLYVTP